MRSLGKKYQIFHVLMLVLISPIIALFYASLRAPDTEKSVKNFQRLFLEMGVILRLLLFRYTPISDARERFLDQ